MSDETQVPTPDIHFEMTLEEFAAAQKNGTTWGQIDLSKKLDLLDQWLPTCANKLYQKYHDLKAENKGLKQEMETLRKTITQLQDLKPATAQPVMAPEPVVANVAQADEPLEVAEAPMVIAEATTEVVAEAPVVEHPAVSQSAIQEDDEPVVAEVASESESRGKLPKPAVTQSDTADKEPRTLQERLDNNTGNPDRTLDPRSQKNQSKYDTVRERLSRPPEGQPDWVARAVTAAIIILVCVGGYFSYSTYKQNKTDNKQAGQQRISTLPAEIVATVDKSKLAWLRGQDACKKVLSKIPKANGFGKVRLRISFVKKLRTAPTLTQHHALATCWLTANFTNKKVKQVRDYLFKLEKNTGKYPNGVALSATTTKKGKEPLLYLEKIGGMKKLFTSHDSKDSLGTATVGYFQVRVEKPGWFDWLWK